MASLVKRANSMVWWIGYRDKNGERRYETTGYRSDDVEQTKLAHALEARMTSQEYERKTISDEELWAIWVPDFLKRHVKGRSYERYLAAWQQIYSYLREIGVLRPRNLTYQHALGFLKWRTAQKRRGGKFIKLNTALNDIKVLRLVMRQAVRLSYCEKNCCDRLGVAKDEVGEKPEFTNQDIIDIRAKLDEAIKVDGKLEWMRISFEIALNTGCRISETVIHFSNIDFTNRTITFGKPKGGKERAFSIPLPTAIESLLVRIKTTGATTTLTLPKMSGKIWWEFFTTHFSGKRFCFHCTRVSFITRLARAGVPIYVAMKLVNHASTLIHRIYQRLGVEDVRRYSDAIQLPAA